MLLLVSLYINATAARLRQLLNKILKAFEVSHCDKKIQVCMQTKSLLCKG